MPLYFYHRHILAPYGIRATRLVRRRPVPAGLAKVQAEAAELSRAQRRKLLGEIAKKHSKAEAERLAVELFPAKKPAQDQASTETTAAQPSDKREQ